MPQLELPRIYEDSIWASGYVNDGEAFEGYIAGYDPLLVIYPELPRNHLQPTHKVWMSAPDSLHWPGTDIQVTRLITLPESWTPLTPERKLEIAHAVARFMIIDELERRTVTETRNFSDV